MTRDADTPHDDSLDDCTDGSPLGPINVLATTARAFDDSTLTTLPATAVEAKAATLAAETSFTWTTPDAVVVGADTDGDRAASAGSATLVSATTRACVREAVRAGLAARHPDRKFPHSVLDADHGTVTDRRATVFAP